MSRCLTEAQHELIFLHIARTQLDAENRNANISEEAQRCSTIIQQSGSIWPSLPKEQNLETDVDKDADLRQQQPSNPFSNHCFATWTDHSGDSSPKPPYLLPHSNSSLTVSTDNIEMIPANCGNFGMPTTRK